MNEVDRMSNPEAGDPPIEDRWKPLPRLESSDMWWALLVLGSLSTAIGSNWQTYLDMTTRDPRNRRHLGLLNCHRHSGMRTGGNRRLRHCRRPNGQQHWRALARASADVLQRPGLGRRTAAWHDPRHRRPTVDPGLRLDRLRRTDAALSQLPQGRVVPGRPEEAQHPQNHSARPAHGRLTSMGEKPRVTRTPPTPANQERTPTAVGVLCVGATGIEPVTSAVSRLLRALRHALPRLVFPAKSLVRSPFPCITSHRFAVILTVMCTRCARGPAAKLLITAIDSRSNHCAYKVSEGTCRPRSFTHVLDGLSATALEAALRWWARRLRRTVRRPEVVDRAGWRRCRGLVG